MLGHQTSQMSLLILGLLISILSPEFVELSCVENDCNNAENEENRSDHKADKKDVVPFMDMVQNEPDIRIYRELNFPYDYVLKSNPEIKWSSDLNQNLSPLLPVIEKMAKKTKQNVWLKRFPDFKRTEGNRNFQTQGWK